MKCDNIFCNYNHPESNFRFDCSMLKYTYSSCLSVEQCKTKKRYDRLKSKIESCNGITEQYLKNHIISERAELL